MAITLYAMMNGQFILGYLQSVDGDAVKVKNALIVAPQQTQQGIQLALLPMGFPIISDPKKQPEMVSLNSNSIMYSIALDESKPEYKPLVEEHRKNFSNIILNAGGIKAVKP